MRSSLIAVVAFASPIFAQRPPPMTTTDYFGGPGENPDPTKSPKSPKPEETWLPKSPGTEGYIPYKSPGPEGDPSTLTAAPWPTDGFGPGSGPGNRGPGGPGGPDKPDKPGKPDHWGGPDGPGPFGPGNWGPNPGWDTRSDIRDGPWTRWWGGSACPPTDWPGWTAGPWRTRAPWPSWPGCTARTTGTIVMTRTVNGTVVRTTDYQVQVAALGNEGTGAGAKITAGIGIVIGVAALGLAVGL